MAASKKSNRKKWQSTTPHVAAVFSRYTDTDLTADSIRVILRDEYQLERSRDQVVASCSRLVNDTRYPGIHTPSRGVYHNTAESSEDVGDRVFSEIGPTKDGRIVLECTDGSLYVAEPL